MGSSQPRVGGTYGREPGDITLRFRFRLREGIDALTAPSIVYDYCNPEAHFDHAPTRFIAGLAAMSGLRNP